MTAGRTRGAPDADAYEIYNCNGGYYLESFRLLTSTGTGTPFRA